MFNVSQINKITGEIIDREPSFFKTYIKDLGKIAGLTKTESSIMNEMLMIMDYQNKVGMLSGRRKSISKSLDINVKTISSAISRMIELGIIVREDRCEYMFNPSFFAKGSWTDVKDKKEKYLNISVKYTKGKKKEISVFGGDKIQSV